jgi:class 3 adenylate cyclase
VNVERGPRQITFKSGLIMAAVALSVTSAAFWTLYEVVLERTRVQLVELADSQARLIEAVAKFDAIHARPGRASRAATLSQIRESHFRYRGFGETGEILLGERQDSLIHFLLPEHELGFRLRGPVSYDATRPAPMTRAVSGESGLMQGMDVDGQQVLAAYRYLPFLEVGLVSKIAMSEIRSPFYHAAIVTFGLAVLSLIVGIVLQRRMVAPLVSEVFTVNRELKEREAKLASLSTQLSRYLSPPLYKSMFEGASEARIFTQRKKLTVFFSDIVGFTARTDGMEPEDVSYQLNSYFDTMARIVSRHGGTLDKFIGDAVMAFFGDPESRGLREDAIACLEMAWDMRETVARLAGEWREHGIGGEFQVRMGISTGYCTVGNFGSESRMEYTIIGNTVNLAERIETAAQPGEILISDATHELVRSHFECVEREPLRVKGFHKTIRTYQVLRPKRDLGAASVRAEGEGFSVQLDPDVVAPDDRARVAKALEDALAALRREDEDG